MKYNTQKEIEQLLETYMKFSGVVGVRVTPTYISMILEDDDEFIMHYDKRLIKFQGARYTNYNFSYMYDKYFTLYDSSRYNKTSYYPNPSIKNKLGIFLREDRISVLLEDSDYMG